MEIDINELRDTAIALHSLDKADEVYTLYHDETNNIRRLHITANGLNVREPGCFVLGGIAHKGVARDLGFDRLRSGLKLQKTVTELKLKHIGNGDFPDLLASGRLATLLNWITENGLFIHFHALDVLYWSIVDIIDSIVTDARAVRLMMMARDLKNDLYRILRHDMDGTVNLFKRYSYPNVGPKRRSAFVAELLDVLQARSALLPDFNYRMLKGVLEMGRNAASLPYLENEDPDVLIAEFSNFYLQRIFLFNNSAHILDVEVSIEARLRNITFTDRGRPFNNYRFVDSTAEPGIQVADTVAGLLGKAFTFIIRNTAGELRDALSRLSPAQAGNLAFLRQLLNRSIAENPAFADFVLSYDDRDKACLLLD
jgi:Protein of unknown function (DUF3800)